MAHSPAPWTIEVGRITKHKPCYTLSDANSFPLLGDWMPARLTEDDKALIRTAPDLLDACKLALSVISELDHIYSDRQKEAEQKLAEAIAKATNPIQANQSDADILSRQIVAEEYHCGKCGRLLTDGKSHNCTNPIQTT